MPGWHGPHHSVIVFVVLDVVAFAGGGFWWTLGERIPPWGFQVSLVLSTSIVSIAAATLNSSLGVNFAALYVWAAVYAALYFRPVAVVLQTGFAGISYMGVLYYAHATWRTSILSWFSIFGTAVVLSAVVLGLVSLLRQTSSEDPLTHLANRRIWQERIDEELERSLRSNTPLSLAIMDIDNFKAVNDCGGHQAGDRIPRSFADGWVDVVRGSGDFLARIGGDEFGLIAPGSDSAGLQRIVERLREISPEHISSSIGTATWNRVETGAELFRRADEAMYQAKAISRET